MGAHRSPGEPTNRFLAALLVLGVGGAVAGCVKGGRPAVMRAAMSTGSSPAPTAQSDLDPATVVATIDGRAITARDIDNEITSQLGQLSQKYQSEEFELRKQALDDMLVMRLVDAEAKKEGTTVDAWTKKYVEASTPEASEADAKKFFDENTAKMGGRSFDQEKSHIVAFLTHRKRQETASKIFDDLKSKAKVEILLEEPVVEVNAVGPSLGHPNAPVTIVEFSDFQCPFCSKVEPTIKRVMADYPGKVRFVFRDFPLSFHDRAEKASEASHCAEEQERYWPMHDALFANQDKLDVDGLKKLAAGVPGMDQVKFDKCLDSGEMKDEVASNERAGEAAGVSGTPRFFVNGHPLDGVQPYDEFKRMIDRELSRNVSK
jgi:protein-disulfide isomerase